MRARRIGLGLLLAAGAALTSVPAFAQTAAPAAATSGRGQLVVVGLRALGHTVNTGAQSSGISTILKRSNPQGFYYYEGGADPRRENLALGDTFKP